MLAPEPENKYFGYFVNLSAGAHAGGNAAPKRQKTCWVSGRSASGSDTVKDEGKFASMGADYSYSISPAGIDASSHVYGNLNNNTRGSGSGNVILWLMWHDTLTFHSKQLQEVKAGDPLLYDPEKIAMKLAKSEIGLKMKLMQNPPQCSGRSSTFRYTTGVMAVIYPQDPDPNKRNAMGSWGPVRPPGSEKPNPLADDAENQILVEDMCGVGKDYSHITVLNGWPLPIHMTVQEILNGTLESPRAPEGHLKVEMSKVRMCFEKPGKAD